MTLAELREIYAENQDHYFELQAELNDLRTRINEMEAETEPEDEAGTITITTTFANGEKLTHSWDVTRKPTAAEIKTHLDVKYWHNGPFTWTVTGWNAD